MYSSVSGVFFFFFREQTHNVTLRKQPSHFSHRQVYWRAFHGICLLFRFQLILVPVLLCEFHVLWVAFFCGIAIWKYSNQWCQSLQLCQAWLFSDSHNKFLKVRNQYFLNIFHPAHCRITIQQGSFIWSTTCLSSAYQIRTDVQVLKYSWVLIRSSRYSSVTRTPLETILLILRSTSK